MVRSAVISILLSVIIGFACGAESFEHWPQWRGPEMTGIAENGDPPVEWGEDKNIKWKTEIPGLGHSSPIIWDDKIFIQTAIETDKSIDPRKVDEEYEKLPEWRRRSGKKSAKVHKFDILAIDRHNGEVIWQRTAHESVPHAGTHGDGSWASNSPVTDGEHTYAYFGSYGLHCFDMDGNLIWQKSFGKMSTKMDFGEGSSPAIHGDRIIINWDHEEQSFVVALDKKTGEEIWKVDRDERTSWSTPIVVEHNGRKQVIISATNRIRSYDLKDGEQIWECGGMTGNVVPTPVLNDGILYFASGFRGNALLAVRLDRASGDITDSEAVIWKSGKNTPYVPSLLVYGDLVYSILENKGILTCFGAKTGDENYSRQKLEGIRQIYSSPLGASRRVYLIGKNGAMLVIRHSPEFEVLAANSLDDEFTASPAVIGKYMYLRGHRNLYCIGRDQ